MTNRRSLPPFAFVLALCLLGAACTGSRTRPSLTGQPLAELESIQQSPEQTGDWIYDGSVSPLDGNGPVELFRYARRVRQDGSGLTSTHITYDRSGAVLVVQRARHDGAYALARADMMHKQTGSSGSVEVSGRRVRFTLIEDGRLSTADEEATDPVVAGPTMFGFILAHWDRLERGESLPIRFAVLERQETLGFALEKVDGAPGRTTIRMTPTSVLIRLAIAPTYFEFDASSRRILEYAGRVPPLQQVGDELRTLDARVNYTFRAASFR